MAGPIAGLGLDVAGWWDESWNVSTIRSNMRENLSPTKKYPYDGEQTGAGFTTGTGYGSPPGPDFGPAC